MAHTASQGLPTEAELKSKVKKYINVFYGLIALTVIELIIVALPLNATLMALLVGVFSSAKAVVVGYYYMHLEHETKWLQWVACLPIIAFGYAFVLMADAPTRPASVYDHAPKREFKGHLSESATHPGFAPELKALPEGALEVEVESGFGASKLDKKVFESGSTQTDSPTDSPPPAVSGAGKAESGSTETGGDSGEWN